MRRLSSCCRKPAGLQDPEPESELEPKLEPKPEPKPEPEPESESEPCSTVGKTNTPVAELKQLKAPRPFTEFSILCMENTKRLDPDDSSSDVRDATICFRSDRNNKETIINIMERAKKGEKSFLDNSEQKICFLRAISASCQAARETGQDSLNLPYSKDELAEIIVLVMKTLPVHSVPPTILYTSSSLNKTDKGSDISTNKGNDISTNKGIDISTNKGNDISTNKGSDISTNKGNDISTNNREQIQ